MKHKLIFLLYVLLIPTVMSAQKHSCYVDVGYPLRVAATYNYKLARYLGIGAGIQGFNVPIPGDTSWRFTSSVFANIRINIMPAKKNQLFISWDLGMNFYRQDKSYYRDSAAVYQFPHSNGFHLGLLLGYFRKITKRGGGPYLSLGLLGNCYILRGYGIASEEAGTARVAYEGRPVFCLGFKF